MGAIKKIMICDDSITIRKKLFGVLEKVEGCEIIEAENGQIAVDLYKQYSPDIVFMDIIMPQKDGIEAVREIVEFDKDANIIMASSVGTKNNLKQALESGARDFIQKPWDDIMVINLVNKLTKER